MARTVKHFSLHRIAGTELRVVADVETGVLPVIQEEAMVVQGYAQQKGWSHRWVTLFVLQDIQPLARQLGPGVDLPPGGAPADLERRPVVNVYDLADPTSCHVFVNQQVLVKLGYWDDSLSIRGLLAHEHAHPLAENAATRGSRRLQLDLSLERSQPAKGQGWTKDRQDRLHHLLALLANKLCLYAPREVFANEVTIRSGFGDALLHLDRRNVTDASLGMAGREKLREQLRGQVTQGKLAPAGADLLLLVGDMNGYMDLALEVAPFYRTDREGDARELEGVLEKGLFPHLEPEVARAYTALRGQYIALRADLAPAELKAWGESVLGILAEALAEKGLILGYRLWMADD